MSTGAAMNRGGSKQTITHHAEIVLRAAASWANGSVNAAEIGESIAFVCSYVGDMEEETETNQQKELL